MKKTSLLATFLMLAMLLSGCSSSIPTPSPTSTPTPTPAPRVSFKPIPTAVPIKPNIEYSIGEEPVYKDGLESDGKIHVYLVGNGETVKAKDSTSIRSLTYYEKSKHLIINFNGKEYVFANVSSSLWDSFKEASSSDAFYDSHLKGDKSYWINDYNGKNGGLIVMENVK